MAIDVRDFQQEVIEESHNHPVLVDFWAQWCQPCLMLAPILEKVYAASDADWVLAKVNVDQNQQLAMQYGVRGIPSLKLFHNGEIIAEQSGVLPEPQLKQWLEQHLPGPEIPEGEGPEAIRAHIEAGAFQEAYTLAENYHQNHPNDDEGRVLLALLAARNNPALVEPLVQAVAPGSKFSLEAESARFLVQLYEMAAEASIDVPDGKLKTKFLAGLEALNAYDFEAALQYFIEVVGVERNFFDGAARKACLAIFHLLGSNHPLTRTYRRRFDMALY